MPAFAASAPGKIILFGEHAVVYSRPAIAVPVTQVQAKAVVSADLGAPAGRVWIQASDIRLDRNLSELPADHPFAITLAAVQAATGVERLPALRLKINSTIPIAAGLGSGAAISAAIARALSAFLGRPLSDEQVSAVAYRVDQKYHGTPSGIDNTVIAYAQPVFFVRGQPFERLETCEPFNIVIGNTGISSQTKMVVGAVRSYWQADPQRYEHLFDEIGAIANKARRLIENGPTTGLGPLMNQNHGLLQAIDVSSPALDRLVTAALAAGALGAKLCGGGRGGNMIALVQPQQAEAVTAALRAAGAVNTITTQVGKISHAPA
jgi:mevalonate kinase